MSNTGEKYLHSTGFIYDWCKYVWKDVQSWKAPVIHVMSAHMTACIVNISKQE